MAACCINVCCICCPSFLDQEVLVFDEPGMPTKVTPSFLSGNQRGTISVNTESNPHWNDVLSYTPDGSLIRYNDMDFMPIQSESYMHDYGKGSLKFNKICGKRCCVKKPGLVKETRLTWMSTDGVHKIGLVHVRAPKYTPQGAGVCRPFTPCCCLCISQTACKPLFRRGGIDYQALFAPETFEVTWDGEVVATLDVTPGFQKDSPEDFDDEERMERMTTAKDKSGATIFVMNDVFTPVAEDKNKTLRCGQTEDWEGSTGKSFVNLPQNHQHKAHRVIYPLAKTQGSKDDTYGWAAYTHFENSTMSHRATLTMDPKKLSGGAGDAPKEVLASLPVLVDLAIGSTGGHRRQWTFWGREFYDYFDPEAVVNYFEPGEKLQTVIANYTPTNATNPKKGDIAPKQQTMEDERKATRAEKAAILGKSTGEGPVEEAC